MALPSLADSIRRQMAAIAQKDEGVNRETVTRASFSQQASTTGRRGNFFHARRGSISLNGKTSGAEATSSNNRTNRASTAAAALVYGVNDEMDILTMNIHGADYGLNKLVKKVQNRRDGWMKRFADSLDESMVYQPPLSIYEQAALEALKPHEVVRPPPLPKPSVHIESGDLLPFTERKNRTAQCLECSMDVPLGAEMLECQTCPMVCHLRCCKDVQQFVIKKEAPPEYSVQESACTPRTASTEVTGGCDAKVSSSTFAVCKSVDLSAPPVIVRKGSKNLSPVAKALAKKEISRALLRSGSDLTLPTILNSSPGVEKGVGGRGGSCKQSFGFSRPQSVVTGLVGLDDIDHSDDPHWQLTAKEVRWVCKFCRLDVLRENALRDSRYESQLRNVTALRSAIKLQAFMRMVMWRRKLQRAKVGFTLLQRAVRVREMARKDEQERANERHPFRIRLHEVRLFLKDPEIFARDLQMLSTVSAAAAATAASVSALSRPGTADLMGRNDGASERRNSQQQSFMSRMTPAQRERIEQAQRFKQFPALPAPRIIGEMTAMGFDKIFGEFKVAGHEPDEKDQEMVELLSAGHQESPIFAKTFRSLQHVPAGTVFLTITVHELCVVDAKSKQSDGLGANRRPVQVCRYDLPLKRHGRNQRLSVAMLEKQGYADYLDSKDLEFVASRFRQASFVAQKPYILIPYSRANAEIKVTISVVTEWPKAVVVGQSVINSKYYISRKRVLSITQFLEPISYVDIPSSEDGVKLSMVLPRPSTADQQVEAEAEALNRAMLNSRGGGSGGGGRAVTPNTGAASMGMGGTGGGAGSANSPSKTRTRPRAQLHESRAEQSELAARKKQAEELEYSGGVVTWTLLPMGYSELNDRGFLLQLNQEVITSTKKKCWCILIDKIMTVFSIVRETIKVKHVIDVRTSWVSLGADDVIKIKTNSETLYFLPLTQKEHENWFRKLYTQGMSQSVQAYHLYMRKKGARKAHRTESTDLTSLLEGNLSRGRPGGAASSKGADRRPSRLVRTRTSYEEVELMDLQIQGFLDQMREEYINKAAEDLTDFLPHAQVHRTTTQYLDTLASAFVSNLHRF